MNLGDRDITAILADFAAAGSAVRVTLGEGSATGLLDREAVEIFAGEMPALVAAEHVVHLQSGALPGLEPGAAITVAGTPFVVLKVLPYGDGAMVRALLRTP
jgi:hypothetical protein